MKDDDNVSAAQTMHGNTSNLHAWFALLSVAIGAFALMTSELLPVGLLAGIAKNLQVSVGMAGLMVTAPGILAAVVAPLITILIGDTDRRRVLWVLTLMMITSNFSVTFASNYAIVLIGRLLLGVAIGGFWATALALSGRLAPRSVSIGGATSIIMAGVTLATVLGVPIGTWMGAWIGWRSAFAVTGSLSTLVLLAQLIMLPCLPAHSVLRFHDLFRLFNNHNARIGLLVVIFLMMAQYSSYTYVSPFFVHRSFFGSNLIALLFLIYGASGILGNFMAGIATSNNLWKTFLSVIAVMMFVLFLFPFLGVSKIGAIILMALWGTVFGALPVCSNVWMFFAAPGDMEGGSAILVSTYQIGIAMGSLIGGAVIDIFNISSATLVGVAFSAIALIVLAIYGRGLSNPQMAN